jgi:uncharacterized membrane protein
MTSNAPVAFAWTVIGWALLLPPAWHSWQALRRGPPLAGAQQHVWLAGVVFLAWLWTLQVRTADGATLGLLGAAFYALVFGRDWARLGLLAALVVHAVATGGSWANLGIEGLLLAVLPTTMTDVLRRQIELRLPRNLFVFIIGNGLFVTLAVTATTSAALLAAARLTAPAAATVDQFAYALLLAWGEALASGMLFSALVIFGPHLVLTYRQDLYLPPRRGA